MADVTIAVVPWDDDEVARLGDEQQAELAAMSATTRVLADAGW